MSATVSKPGRMTVEQYLDWAQAQPEGRYELVNGEPRKMPPERNVHALVKGLVYLGFREAVADAHLDFAVLTDGPTVVINAFRSREPDLVVQSAAEIDWNAVTVESPVIIVEVTSPSTMRTDTDDKLIEYFSLASVQHYLLVHPAQQVVVHHRRIEGSSIETRIVSGGSLRFDPPGFSLTVERFFAELPPGKAN